MAGFPSPAHGEGARTDDSVVRQMLNKVPEITLYFWVIKILCTTVGETAADFINSKLHLGLTKTTYIMGALLAVTLAFQFASRKYVPAIYWLAVVLLSVVGTLITDNLTDHFGVSLVTTTVIFAISLAVVFSVWYAFEKSLSIHTILTYRRETFYWLAILFTFALGTASGDLIAEKLGLGYFVTLLIIGGLIAAVAVAHFAFKLNEIASFWIVYILTRPLGASLGDLLSQSRHDGGMGFGTMAISGVFLAAISVMVVYLSITKRDVSRVQRA